MIPDDKGPSFDRVCAIIVTFHPDQDFPSRFCAMTEQVETMFIVDNGSNPEALSMLKRLVNRTPHQLIRNSENLGVATALNQGVRAALADGFEWTVTLDQDSIPEPEMVSHLLESLLAYPEPHRIALVGPNIIYRTIADSQYRWTKPNERFPFMFERVAHTGHDMDDVTIVITSGALTNLQAWEDLDGFRDDFFIDYVDTEYCLRAKRAGYKVLVSAKAKLYHRLGEKREVKRLGVTLKPTFHSPLRLYYVARNRIPMVREYALAFPHWFLFDMVAAGYNTLRILLTEDKRLQKLGAMAQGTWDGLLGRMGPKR